MRLFGDANDYFGKGLSGGRLSVQPPAGSRFSAEEQIIAGNVILYGATAGEVFIRGQVGERFCVRNSGATAVVEGVGDHGCEYMTGGLVVVLGPTGRNFAAGMSGGIAYVHDPSRTFGERVNTEMVDVEPLNAADRDLVRSLVERHRAETDSAVAERLLGAWGSEVGEFVKVMPRDYRRILEATALAEAQGRSVDEAVMEAAAWVSPPDSWSSPAACRGAARCRCGCGTGGRSTSPSRRRPPRSRAPAAWTAASPSATTAARWATSSRSGTTWSTRDDWPEAIERLHATNNFPEFTGRLCPAPCEAACVLGINEDPVTIERIEYEIVERAWDEGWVTPQVPTVHTGKSVAVIGSGPAGLAAAQQLTRAGHHVTVFERAERPGGLLRYGIPEFKMEKAVLDRRLAQLEAEGVTFVCSTQVGGGATADGSGGAESGGAESGGSGTVPSSRGGARHRHRLRARRHRAAGHRRAGRLRRPRAGRRRHHATRPGRARARAGRRAFAMEYLKPSNLVQEGDLAAPLDQRRGQARSSSSAAATPVPTAWARPIAKVPARCTSSRSCPSPQATGRPTTPGRVWPLILRTSSAHEEGGERLFSVTTTEFVGDDGPGPSAPCGATRSRCAPRTAARSSSPWRAPNSRSSASWCSWPWASSGPSATPSSTSWASR